MSVPSRRNVGWIPHAAASRRPAALRHGGLLEQSSRSYATPEGSPATLRTGMQQDDVIATAAVLGVGRQGKLVAPRPQA